MKKFFSIMIIYGIMGIVTFSQDGKVIKITENDFDRNDPEFVQVVDILCKDHGGFKDLLVGAQNGHLQFKCQCWDGEFFPIPVEE